VRDTQFWGVLSGRTPDGEVASFWVYRSGPTLIVTDPSGMDYVCHPSIRTLDDLKKEFLLHYRAEVVGVTSAGAPGN
jgi:hypothetical protein